MEIREYVMPNGKAPFVEWIDKLRGREGNRLVLLLCGGNKSTQRADVRLANKYWQDYRSRSDE